MRWLRQRPQLVLFAPPVSGLHASQKERPGPKRAFVPTIAAAYARRESPARASGAPGTADEETATRALPRIFGQPPERRWITGFPPGIAPLRPLLTWSGGSPVLLRIVSRAEGAAWPAYGSVWQRTIAMVYLASRREWNAPPSMAKPMSAMRTERAHRALSGDRERLSLTGERPVPRLLLKPITYPQSPERGVDRTLGSAAAFEQRDARFTLDLHGRVRRYESAGGEGARRQSLEEATLIRGRRPVTMPSHRLAVSGARLSEMIWFHGAAGLRDGEQTAESGRSGSECTVVCEQAK